MEKSEIKFVEEQSEHFIHPNFRIHFGAYGRDLYQNFKWDKETMGLLEDSTKTTFTFDDVEQLNDCPFVCKITLNLKGKGRYFGVAYAPEDKLNDLKVWASKFGNAELMKF